MDNFFQLSVELQIALGAGYLGYLTAYLGIRSHHQQIDVAFLTVVFGLVATVTASFVPNDVVFWKALAACVSSISAGVFWRRWGRQSIRSVLKLGRLAYSDDDPTVLTAIASDVDHNVTQAVVVLTDGTELVCGDTAEFADAPIAPFIFGADGSIGLYVTASHRRDSNGQMVESARKGTRDPSWGDRMTIIPSSNVLRVELRFQRKNQSSRAGGGGLGGASAGAEGV